VHRGLGDADNRAVGQFTRGVQSRVAEAGDDVPVHAFAFALGDFVQQPGDGQRLVVVALDRDRPGLHDPASDAALQRPEWAGDDDAGTSAAGAKRTYFCATAGIFDQSIALSLPSAALTFLPRSLSSALSFFGIFSLWQLAQVAFGSLSFL